MAKRYRFFLLAGLLAGVAAGGMFWKSAVPTPPPPELQNHLLPAPREITPFRLVDHAGAAFDLSRLRGKWTVLFFGYTHCPDVCPTTLLTLNGTIKAMERSTDGVDHTQFVFVSVDPKRDTHDQLKTYLAYFDQRFIGATGERAQIDALVAQFGAAYMMEGDTAGDAYVVNHSVGLYVADPKGRLVARLLPPHDPDKIAQTLARVRHYYAE